MMFIILTRTNKIKNISLIFPKTPKLRISEKKKNLKKSLLIKTNYVETKEIVYFLTQLHKNNRINKQSKQINKNFEQK